MCTRYRFNRGVFLSLSLLFIVGCGRVLGIEERPIAPVDAGGAGDGAFDDGAVGPEAACSLRPPVPNGDDLSDDGLNDLVFAIHEMDFGDDKDGWKKLGFDLDHLDTQPDGGASLCRFTGTAGAQPPAAWWDSPCGSDNAGGGLVWKAASVVPSLPTNLQRLTTDFQSGNKGLLIRIQGYNGMPNDASVIVSVIETSGFPEGSPAPKWDGTDLWTVNKQSLANLNPVISAYLDQNAYIAKGVVVAMLDPFPIRMALGNTGIARLPIEHSQISAKLVKDGKSGFYKLLEGRLGGSLRPAALFRIAGATNETCLTSANIFLLQKAACIYRDTALSVSSDDGGLACDSFSIGVGFEAWAAGLGTILDVPDVAGSCPELSCPP